MVISRLPTAEGKRRHPGTNIYLDAGAKLRRFPHVDVSTHSGPGLSLRFGHLAAMAIG